MSSVELLTEGRTNPTMKDIFGRKTLPRRGTPVDLSPALKRKPFTMPDGTVKEAVTGEEVFIGEWEAYQGQLETELGRPLTDDELEEAAIAFLEYCGPELLATCNETAAWINESGPGYYELEAIANRTPEINAIYNAISRTIRR
jgi:hypothetical protein